MNVDDCYNIGAFIKPHGFKGGLSLKLDVDNPQEYKELDSLFILIGGRLVPFFMKSYELGNKGIAKVHLEDVDTELRARDLVGLPLYLPLQLLPPLSGNKFYYHEITGFNVVDKEKGPIGTVSAVLDNGPQAILQVDFNKQEILIPISDPIILKVDRDQKTLTVDCPEGLIDLYLGS